jgi:type II secretory pathway pseudopilin PulG
MAVMSVITGILAAAVLPQMTGLMAKNSLQSSMNEVTGAIREAQRSAMKNGRTCTVNLSSTGVSSTNTSTNICMTSPVSLSSGMTLSVPTGSTMPSTFSFSYKGNTTTDLTLILSSTKTSTQRCLVISAGIGIMRSGTYENNSCTSSF